MQRLVAYGRVTVKAVPGVQNVADIGTKILTHDRIEELKRKVGVKNLLELAPRQFTSHAAAAVQTPFQKKVAAMFAFLAPQAVATSAAVCRRDLEHFAQEEENKGPGMLLVAMVCLVIGLAVGLAVGCYFGKS